MYPISDKSSIAFFRKYSSVNFVQNTKSCNVLIEFTLSDSTSKLFILFKIETSTKPPPQIFRLRTLSRTLARDLRKTVSSDKTREREGYRSKFQKKKKNECLSLRLNMHFFFTKGVINLQKEKERKKSKKKGALKKIFFFFFLSRMLCCFFCCFLIFIPWLFLPFLLSMANIAIF